MEAAHLLRPMGLLEIVDESFRLYRANFWLLFGTAAAAVVPLTTLLFVPRIGAMPVSVLAVSGYAAALAALVQAISERALGRRATLGRSYLGALLRLPSFLLTMLLVGLCISGLLLATAGPAFVASVLLSRQQPPPLWWLPFPIASAVLLVSVPWLLFTVISFATERGRYLRPILRAASLLRPWRWAQVALVGLLTAVVACALAFVVTVFLGMWRASNPRFVAEYGFAVMGLVYGLTGAALLPLPVGTFVLQYRDARVRREGYDVELLSRELSALVPAPDATDPSPTGGVQEPRP